MADEVRTAAEEIRAAERHLHELRVRFAYLAAGEKDREVSTAGIARRTGKDGFSTKTVHKWIQWVRAQEGRAGGDQ